MSMPLSFAKENRVYKVDKIISKENENKHLANLGFVKGEEIKVISNNNQNVIIQIKGAKLALDKSTTRKIYVEELEKEMVK